MRIDATGADTGSAYDLPTPSSDLELVSVGKGTAGGELLRRYWHPIAVAKRGAGSPCRGARAR